MPDLGGLRADEIDYNWHVRPILSENCFKCHGPDASSRKAKLRLDVADVATAELPESKGKFAIVPRHSERSELIRRITSRDPDERMPPESTHKTLTRAASRDPAAVDRQRRRVRGALGIHPAEEAGRAARPRSRAESRTTSTASCSRSSSADGLSPAREADKETLINRVTLDAHGPAAEDRGRRRVLEGHGARRVRAARRSLARVAGVRGAHGRILARPRALQRERRLSRRSSRSLPLAVARLGDRGVSTTNMPFDRFGIEQLAGDLLPGATKDQVLATAFLRVGKRTTENGAIDAEYKAEYMVDRTDNALGVAFLGLTVGCARCHDHKYDPIKQRDYYSLGAFFNSNDEPGAYAPGFSGIQGGPTLPWPDKDAEKKLDAARASSRHARPSTTRPSPRRSQARKRPRASSLGRRGSGRCGPARCAREQRGRVLPVRFGAARVARGPTAAARAAHPAADADRLPPERVRRRAAAPEGRDARAAPRSRAGAASGARAAQLQRRVADAVGVRDAGRRAGRDPVAAAARRRARQGALVRRDESRLSRPRRRLLRPPVPIRSPSTSGST